MLEFVSRFLGFGLYSLVTIIRGPETGLERGIKWQVKPNYCKRV